MDVPAGALDADTTLSITETGTGFELATNQGAGLAFFGVNLQPAGLVFNVPITLTFTWADADNNGKIDGTSIREKNLLITKDNVAITNKCNQASNPAVLPFCDQAANTFTFEVSSLSEFVLLILIEAAGAVPDGAGVPGTPLTLDLLPNGDLTLAWGASCIANDGDYAIYEGTLGTFTSHLPKSCDTGGATTTTVTPAPGSTYYIVVPRNGAREGSYGLDSTGERPPSGTACLVQSIGTCP